MQENNKTEEVAAIDVLAMHSGLELTTIKKSYSWAISAMNEFASRKVLEYEQNNSEVTESVNFPEGESNLNEASPLNTAHPSTSDSLNENGQYILIAYRYGNQELHSYFVDLCDAYDTAIERAEKEADERGGKYSVIVYAKRKTGDIQLMYEAKCNERYRLGLSGFGIKIKALEENLDLVLAKDAELCSLNEQLQSQLLQAQKEVDSVKEQRDEYFEIIKELVELKSMKDSTGKSDIYLKRQPLAWEAAINAIQNKL